jgi:hypothetical protein
MMDYATLARAAIVVIIACGSSSGCAQYVDRKDTIAFSAGNAVQTNIVTHVADPWPANARNRNFAVDGQRMQRAVENYRCGRTGSGGTGADNGGGPSSSDSATPSSGNQAAC